MNINTSLHCSNSGDHTDHDLYSDLKEVLFTAIIAFVKFVALKVRYLRKGKDCQYSYPHKQIKVSPVPAIIRLKLVAALKGIHEAQHLTVESTAVETGLKASTGIETEQQQRDQVEHGEHKDSQYKKGVMFLGGVYQIDTSYKSI